MTLLLVLALAALVVFLHFTLRPERGADHRAAVRLQELHRREAVDRARFEGHPPPRDVRGRLDRMLRNRPRPTARDVLDRLAEPAVTGPGAVRLGVPSPGDPYRRPTPVDQVTDLRQPRSAQRGTDDGRPHEQRQAPG